MRPALLSEDLIQRELSTLAPLWHRDGNSLLMQQNFTDFVDAMIFVNAVAELAETHDHHPDIDIRYNRVRLSLTTHDAGGLTSLDFTLARSIQAMLS
jgi:4a-hydroxytetrahydrobiopterin dehydratase